jgi:TolA-binding protein/peroxiredoxin
VLVFVCAGFLFAGCKKAPSPQKTEKETRDNADLATLFAGDPESLAEFQRVQEDIRAHNYPAAVQGLQKMAARSSGEPWKETVDFNLGQAYMMMSQYQKAQDLFEQFLRDYPSSKAAPRALLYRGQIYMSMGSEASPGLVEQTIGRQHLKRAVDIFEQVLKRYSSDREIAAQAQYLIGSTYASLRDFDKAENSLDKVVAEYKESTYAPKAMYRASGVLLSKGDIDGAERSFGLLTTQYPKSLEAEKAKKKLEGLGIVGTQAPPVAIKEWIGEPPQEIQTRQGKVMLLSFWAIWCPHCRQNIPNMDRLVEQYGGQGLLVVGIRRERAGYEVDKIREFIKTHPMRYATGIDDEGKTSAAYVVYDVPCVVLIDRQGRIRWHGHPEFIQDTFIEALLAETG